MSHTDGLTPHLEQPLLEQPASHAAAEPRVSLYRITDIHNRDTTQVPVYINGQRLEALIDTDSPTPLSTRRSCIAFCWSPSRPTSG